jgi:hypothetical protein
VTYALRSPRAASAEYNARLQTGELTGAQRSRNQSFLEDALANVTFLSPVRKSGDDVEIYVTHFGEDATPPWGAGSSRRHRRW